jgi:hypothetical protein
MEVEEEEEDDEAMDASAANLRDSDTSILDISKSVDRNEGDTQSEEAAGINE